MLDSTRTATPAAIPALAFLTGLATAIFHPLAGPVWLFVLLPPLLAMLARRFREAAVVAIAAAFLAGGGVVGRSHAAEAERRDQQLRAIDPSRFVEIAGSIDRGWERVEYGWKLPLRDARITQGRIAIDATTEITLYLPSDPPNTAGRRTISAEGLLRQSRHGRWYVSVKSSRLVQTSGWASWTDPALWNREASRRLTDLDLARESQRRARALIAAIVLGRGGELPDDLRESYRRGGTYHLLVFSGMQIGFAAAAISIVFRRMRRPRFADLALLSAALIAPRFAGDEPSVSRAAWMIGLYSLTRLLKRPTSTENLLYVSMMMRLTLVPDELTAPGFWLSYGATGGMLLVGKELFRASQRWKLFPSALAWGLGAELVTTPLTLFFFSHYVIGSSLVTLVIAPLLVAMLAVGIVAIAALFIDTTVTISLLDGIALLDQAAVAVNGFSADSLGLSGMTAGPSLALLVTAGAGFVLADVASRSVSSTGWRRLLACCSAAFILFPSVTSGRRPDRPVERLQIVALDVGQGDSLLVRSANTVLLFDGGSLHTDGDFGRMTLVPRLLKHGVTRIDVVALSHPDPDHCSGLEAVLENLAVDELWISSRHFDHPCSTRLLQKAAERAVTIRPANYITTLTVGDLRIDARSPRLRFKKSPLNNSSMVYRVTSHGRSILVTGDIERDAERLLADEEHDFMRADILKVPHHGSRTSSTEEMLDAVRPVVAIVSAGWKNSFGHPHDDVLARLTRRFIMIYRTDRMGDVTVDVSEGPLKVAREIDIPLRR